MVNEDGMWTKIEHVRLINVHSPQRYYWFENRNSYCTVPLTLILNSLSVSGSAKYKVQITVGKDFHCSLIRIIKNK